jgi:hypothetical protein
MFELHLFLAEWPVGCKLQKYDNYCNLSFGFNAPWFPWTLLTLWRIDPLLSSDLVNSRCYAIGEYTNTRFYATVEVSLDYNNWNGVLYVVRAEIL